MRDVTSQKVQFVVKGRSHHASGYLPYLQYLEHLRARMAPPKEHESFEEPYLGEQHIITHTHKEREITPAHTICQDPRPCFEVNRITTSFANLVILQQLAR